MEIRISVIIGALFLHLADAQSANFSGFAPLIPEDNQASALNVRIGSSKQLSRRVQVPQELGDLDLEALQAQLENSNDLAHRVVKECPQISCAGVDCAFVQINGCRMCACPIGSPARGCDRLPGKFWNELMTTGCPNENDPNGSRSPARRVIRWYRHTDPERRISECRFYMFPYCTDSDFNFWRSPRSKAECSHYCFRRDSETNISTEVPLK